jgi:hypothetical protein
VLAAGDGAAPVEADAEETAGAKCSSGGRCVSLSMDTIGEIEEIEEGVVLTGASGV